MYNMFSLSNASHYYIVSYYFICIGRIEDVSNCIVESHCCINSRSLKNVFTQKHFEVVDFPQKGKLTTSKIRSQS